MRSFALAPMFKHIIANNRAGGWRKLKSKPHSVDRPPAGVRGFG